MEEEESLFKADAVNEEDPERDRAYPSVEDELALSSGGGGKKMPFFSLEA